MEAWKAAVEVQTMTWMDLLVLPRKTDSAGETQHLWRAGVNRQSRHTPEGWWVFGAGGIRCSLDQRVEVELCGAVEKVPWS